MTLITAIVSILEHALARPAMHMHDADHVEAVEGFLSGFNTACQALGHS